MRVLVVSAAVVALDTQLILRTVLAPPALVWLNLAATFGARAADRLWV